MNVQTLPEVAITPDCDRRIRDLLCRCFPASQSVFVTTRAWHGSGPAWTVLLTDADALVGHLGIVDRMIRAGDFQIRVAGVQNVCVDPSCRGQGGAARLLASAEALMRQESFDAGLLFCTPQRTRLYVRAGWRLLDAATITRVTADGPAAALPAGSAAMWLPITRTAWPAGVVHLGGNDW